MSGWRLEAGGGRPEEAAEGGDWKRWAFASASHLRSAVYSLLSNNETGGEVSAFVEVFDGFDGFDGEGAKWAVDLAVFGFVVGEEFVPGMVDDLPER